MTQYTLYMWVAMLTTLVPGTGCGTVTDWRVYPPSLLHTVLSNMDAHNSPQLLSVTLERLRTVYIRQASICLQYHNVKLPQHGDNTRVLSKSTGFSIDDEMESILTRNGSHSPCGSLYLNLTEHQMLKKASVKVFLHENVHLILNLTIAKIQFVRVPYGCDMEYLHWCPPRR